MGIIWFNWGKSHILMQTKCIGNADPIKTIGVTSAILNCTNCCVLPG